MKKSNVLFLTLIGAALVLISAVMADNITSVSAIPGARSGTDITSDPRDAIGTETVRQGFKKMGLPLHEGKYWEKAHE